MSRAFCCASATMQMRWWRTFGTQYRTVLQATRKKNTLAAGCRWEQTSRSAGATTLTQQRGMALNKWFMRRLSSIPRQQSLLAVYLLLHNAEGEVLFSQRQNTGWMDGYYSLVAGHVDQGEGVAEAMCREAEEEVGLVLGPRDLSFACCVQRESDPTVHYMDFFFTAELGACGGRLENTEPNKCSDLRFFPRGEPPSKTCPHILHALQCWQNGVALSRFDPTIQ
eukprot:m.220579 g.220579  ORF g.220579 m.220579 type:complete len:224 (-) comp18706_c3_seq3:30-701(-)